MKAGSRPKTQRQVQCGDLVLTFCVEAKIDSRSIRKPLPNPPWQDRAWTLQEKLLSPRCLIFGPSQMRRECLHASFCEETAFEAFDLGTYPASDSIPSPFCRSEVHPPEEEYKQLSFFHSLREFHVKFHLEVQPPTAHLRFRRAQRYPRHPAHDHRRHGIGTLLGSEMYIVRTQPIIACDGSAPKANS